MQSTQAMWRVLSCLNNKNMKPKNHVEIGVDAEDYYKLRILRKNKN